MDDFVYGEPQPVTADLTAAGGSQAEGAVAETFARFKAELGPFNPPRPENNADGFRAIDWDARTATDAVSDDVGAMFPGDFFNQGTFPRARGAMITMEPGTMMRLSAVAESGEP